MLDSSAQRHIAAAPGDTAIHPLYGVIVPDTGTFTRARVERLRSGIDQIYPPVLLLARLSPDARIPPREWTVLLLDTVANRRDNVTILDGAGLGMWIREATPNGFRGDFGPWGIVQEDRGHYCAQRVPI